MSLDSATDYKMLASRKSLVSNLNYVHQQHVSLGVHLSMKSDIMDGTLMGDTGMNCVSGCLHKWKDHPQTALVDANSNDPGMPCQCCDQHLGQEDMLHCSSEENLGRIMFDDSLSPSDPPLSPLSPSSPLTDSSSSSDFTLDDSPVSTYYREYSQDVLESPDQQPDIFPLDSATESPVSPESHNAMWLSPKADFKVGSESPQPNKPENVKNNPDELTATPIVGWNSNSVLDANCNDVPQSHQFEQKLSSLNNNTITDYGIPTGSLERQDNTNRNLVGHHNCPVDGDLLPDLTDVSTQTPKKTITSFHEMAQRRRKSGGQLLPLQKDRSDWLIVFSPDTEQPPVNKLTASTFYNGVLAAQTCPWQAGKGVTTFRELRYRNALNKQGKGNSVEEKGHLPDTEVSSEPQFLDVYHLAEEKTSDHIVTKNEVPQGVFEEKSKEQACVVKGTQKPIIMETPDTAWSLSDHKERHVLSSTKTGEPSMHREFNLKNDAFYIKEQNANETVSAKGGVWIRGMADGGDKRCHEAEQYELLMEERDEDSSPWQKKRFLVAIGSAVEEIICHFNASRNQVQKAQLGDSRLNPKLGYLILNKLCPSLHSLLSDGLKPFQKDVIIGRRRLSPWNLVEASTKTGPESLQILFSNVSHLQQLRDPRRRFNAFIFGLLNMKHLNVWMSHLHEIYEQLSIFFVPTGFLPLAATSYRELGEELQLILQPLSALTFHTDLLFEHYHLPLQDHSSPQQVSSQMQTFSENLGLPSFQHVLDLGGWIMGHTRREIKKSCNPPLDRSSTAQLPTQERDNLQSLSQLNPDTPNNISSPTMGSEQRLLSYDKEPALSATSNDRDLTCNWWAHFSQASASCRYLPSKRDSFTSFRRLMSLGPSDKRQTAQKLTSKDFTNQRSPEISSNGVPKTADNGKGLQRQPDGSPKDSVDSNAGLLDESPSLAEKSLTSAQGLQSTPGGYNDGTGNWLGQLFGAIRSPDIETRNVKSRRPSSWLPPNVNVLSLVRKTSRSESKEMFPLERAENGKTNNSKPERSLRALCDHTASSQEQLTFRKGDVLQLLGTVDEDWIQCRRGSDMGLVPVGYTSLIL